MEPTQIDRMDNRINKLGAALFFHPTTIAYGAEQGIDNVLVLYGGRAGVMGDVTADQVLSAFAFFDEGMIANAWASMAQFGTPSHVAAVYAEGMKRAADELWSEFAGSAVVELGSKVLRGVHPMGLALFAGWRRVALDSGSVAHVIHALRELRGDVHVQSVAATGLAPLEAEFAARGETGAKLHGFHPPYPDPAPFVERLAAAQAATSARMAAIYTATLSEAELKALDVAVGGLSG